MFALQWTPSVCYNSNKCLNVTELWTIHGLWPNSFNRTDYLSNCNNDPFDIDKLDNIINEMDDFWFSYNGNNVNFWQHEWIKHGTCSELDFRKYFSITIDLYKRYNLNKWLSDEDFLPSTGHQFHMAELEKVIQDSFPIDSVQFICQQRKGKQFFLNEIRLCLDTNLKPIDCILNSTCTDKYFYYPEKASRIY